MKRLGLKSRDREGNENEYYASLQLYICRPEDGTSEEYRSR